MTPPRDGAAPRSVILVVEDDPDVANVVSELLDEEGYRVIVATTEADARRLISAANPQAVLIDVVLRDEIVAEELIAELRERSGVVVTSATPAFAELARRHGVPFIPKPFEVEEFLAIVRRASGG